MFKSRKGKCQREKVEDATGEEEMRKQKGKKAAEDKVNGEVLVAAVPGC